MNTMVCLFRKAAVAATLALGACVAGCGLDKSGVDSLTGLSAPSEFALSVTMSAAPDQLPRDGASQSIVTVTVRDASGNPVVGQRLSATASVGTVSQSEIVSGNDGRVVFAFVAPAAGTGSNQAIVRIVPIGSNSQNAVGRTLSIALTGTPGVISTTAPTASFASSPAAPVLRETVVFDATASTDEGARCLDACTYSWNFGGEATGSGRVTSYEFQAARVYGVTLTVTDAAGSIGTVTQNVTVTRGTLPTAAFRVSPATPGQFETVHFNASESVAAAGRTIAGYQWSFGDGSTATGVTASHAFQSIGSGDDARSQTYTVTLTVTDSAGLQGSTSHDVEVVSGVRAAFTYSDPPGSLTVFFNAEESRGSNNGFGGRNSITKYIWHFGDSTDLEEKTSAITSHPFSDAGTYTVTLTVEDSAGRRETTNQEITVAN